MTEQKILTQTYSTETPYNCFKDVIQSFYCILILEATTITQKGQCWPIHFVNDSLGRKCKHSIGHYFITRNVEREGRQILSKVHQRGCGRNTALPIHFQ